MNIKHTLSLIALVLFSAVANAQVLKDINLRLSRDKTTIRAIELFSGNIIIGITEKGNVRLNSLPGTQYNFQDAFSRSGKLAYLDHQKVTYYDEFDDADKIGKLKSIGDITITYYDKFDGFQNIGRVKRIGNTEFTYYDKFDGFDNIGKIKSIGGIRLNYYDRFDGDDINGKLKSVGNTNIAYYDHWDGADRIGRIKSVKGKTANVTINNMPCEELASLDEDFNH